jgi:hypothetical protein
MLSCEAFGVREKRGAMQRHHWSVGTDRSRGVYVGCKRTGSGYSKGAGTPEIATWFATGFTDATARTA